MMAIINEWQQEATSLIKEPKQTPRRPYVSDDDDDDDDDDWCNRWFQKNIQLR